MEGREGRLKGGRKKGGGNWGIEGRGKGKQKGRGGRGKRRRLGG